MTAVDPIDAAPLAGTADPQTVNAQPVDVPTGAAEFRGNWRLLIACTLGTALGFPTLVFYTIGIFAPVFAHEFGWSLSTILAGLALSPIILLAAGPFAGVLVDKYGSRPVAIVALTALGLTYISLAASNGSTVQYLFSWVLIAIAGVGASPMTFTRAISSAFVARRGLAIGITMCGTGLFAFAVKPLAALALAAIGWKLSIIAIGLMPILVGVPVVWWGIPRRQTRADIDPAQPAAPPVDGLSLKAALRTRAFAILAVALFTIALAVGAPLPNMETILTGRGFDPASVVMLASVIGIATIIGRLGGGWLIDHFHAPFVGAAVVMAAACGCWLLSHPGAGFTESMLSILLMGIAGGVEVDLAAYLVARYIGVKSYGAVYAVLFGIFSIGAASGPAAMGYLYDRIGNFDSILLGCAGLMVFASILLILLDPRPGRRRTADHVGVPA